MKLSYQAVVIGGGVVGASVLYHLSKFGWTDPRRCPRFMGTPHACVRSTPALPPLNASSQKLHGDLSPVTVHHVRAGAAAGGYLQKSVKICVKV